MARFIVITFAFLAWAFYEFSGGADFEPPVVAVSEPIFATPEDRHIDAAAEALKIEEPVAAEVVVAENVPQVVVRDTNVELDQLQNTVLTAAQEAALVSITATAPAPSATPAVSNDTSTELRRVTANALNVRGGPSTSDGIVGKLTNGELVTLVDTSDGWSLIRVEGDGVEGWVASRYLAE